MAPRPTPTPDSLVRPVAEGSPVARLGIDDVRPTVSGGTLPSKAVLGEVVDIFALLWREGHDAIAGTVRLTDPQGATHTLRMRQEEEAVNHFHALFVPDQLGTWEFRVEAWSDPWATWRNAVDKKMSADQSAEELLNDFFLGAELLVRAAHGLPKARREERHWLLGAAELLRTEKPLTKRVSAALSEKTSAILAEYPVRDLLTLGETRRILVERTKALVGAWYELFPRSTGGWDKAGNPVHGTFATTEKALERVAAMGFDTVYFPPIHPIGVVNRKGRDNSLVAQPSDVGSPWAIGSADGGHDAVHPELGTVADFEHLIARAKELGLEVAIDLALQCAPDHPWAAEHPEFFTVLPDGTIAYAENPPKKYQDIYPLNFDNATAAIYQEILRVVLLWVERGVRTFRVDNPHTKPTNFWHWLITNVHRTHPEVIFLAEAFTTPPRLYGLSKAGFTQSYTYFTWKVDKEELTEFMQDTVELADVSRPNLFVNTPDILHSSLQYGGRAMFAIRAALAATLSPLWGVYSGYELYENIAVKPGSEEYLHSEKYELRPRDFDGALASGDSLQPFLTRLNEIRRSQPALQQLRTLTFHEVDNENVIAYSKTDPVTGNTLLIVVNLDPRRTQEATVTVAPRAVGLDKGAEFEVHDLITGSRWTWGERNYVRLDPTQDVAHILQLPEVAPHRREELGWRTVLGYHA